ncbi:MAG TPA: glycosyltransferase family 2 protein [Azospirillaceae bacterium]|nr:glycosyltransferase family 2 protein [Azospirillaceae bacterium]
MQVESQGTVPAIEVSVVVPMYNEEEGIDLFYREVTEALEACTRSFEIVCVNDGSRDGTLAKLAALAARDSRIRVVDLSRNFGKEVALTAGIDHAAGSAVIPIDADLQDPPSLIPAMVEKWRDGYEVVLAARADRGSDTALKRWTAQSFYWVMSRVGEVPVPRNVGDFRLMDRKVVEALSRLPERTRFMKGLFAWLGFRQTVVTYSRAPRAAGQTKWKYWKLWNFALDGIVSFSTLPLKIWTYGGIAVALAALVYMMLLVVDTLIHGIDVPGYASIMAGLLFFSGVNMIGLGILGEYLGRVFIEVKQRPLYLVRETWGFENRQEAAVTWIQPSRRIVS